MTTLPTHDMKSAKGGLLASAGRRWLLAASLGLFGTVAAQAQTLNYNAASATNTAGTYTDLGTAGTAIATSETDDANSAAQNIGFTFNYNGTAFTQFVLNTNGVIRLGSAAPSVANLYYDNDGTGVDPLASTSAADVNLIMPFNADLVAGTGTTEYRVATTGTVVGSRVCTIQWKNVSDRFDSSVASQYANFSFQLKLYETGRVEFVYGPAVASTATPGVHFPNIGLKGSGINAGQLVLAFRADPTTAFSTATFAGTNYSSSAFFAIANVMVPDAGRTFAFPQVSAATIDAAVTTVYTLGQIAQSNASPHIVRAVVSNSGGVALTNFPVTLSVSGATPFTNTQTVTSLAAGASTTVTFAAYPLTATGNNTITVTANATGDAISTNNTVTTGQVVGSNMSYTDPLVTTFAGGIGAAAANFVLYAKYTISAPATVTTITPTFNIGTPATATYQVQVYDATGTGGTPGAVLYTSATRTRPTASGPDVVTIPATAVSGSFFVAVKSISATNIALAYQAESPLRTGTFYFSGNGTTFTDVSTSAVSNARLALTATLVPLAPPTCNPVTALSISNVTPTGASVSFTPGTGNTSYTVAYTPTGGTATTITGTASPIALAGLTAGTTYSVTVTPVCAAGGTATASATTFTTTAPVCEPVTALAVGTITGTSAVVSFTPGPGNTSYTVAYTPTGGTAITTVTATASPVTINGLTVSTPYSVSVTPICAAGGTAAAVNTTFTTTNTAPTCDPVTSLATSSVTTTSVSVNFTPGAGNTGYTVTYTPTNGTATTVNATSSPVDLLGLTPGTAYTISVTPICSAGGTAAASTTTVTTTAPTCDPATALAVGAVTPTSASVSFTPGAGNTSYTLTYTPAGGTATTVNATASPVALTGLAAGTLYTVSVTPVCAAGGTAAAVTTTFTSATPSCDPVTALAVGSIITTAASVSFTPGAGNTSYAVTFTPAGGTATTVTSTASPVALTGLTAGTTYTVTVTPVCAAGGTATATSTTFTTQTPPCDPVTVLAVGAVTPTSASVSFTPGAGNAGYTVTYTPAGGTATTVAATASPVALTGLTAGTTYTVSITPVCPNASSPAAVTTTFSTVLTTRSALAGGFVSVFPNPAHQSFTVAIPAVNGARKAQVQVVNALGQVVRTQAVSLSTGTTQAAVEVANLATGLYTVRVQAGSETATVRLTIQ